MDRDFELISGGLIALTVIGIVGWLIWQRSQPAGTQAPSSPANPPDAGGGASGVPSDSVPPFTSGF